MFSKKEGKPKYMIGETLVCKIGSLLYVGKVALIGSRLALGEQVFIYDMNIKHRSCNVVEESHLYRSIKEAQK